MDFPFIGYIGSFGYAIAHGSKPTSLLKLL